MKLVIGIPTYKNNGTTIGSLLDSLARQTYADFRVVIVMKRGDPEGDQRTMDVIERSSKDLDISLVEQKEGFFEEALALLFKEKADVYLTSDDDAVVSPSWVEDHVRVMRDEEVGVATGEIEGQRWVNYPNLLFEKFRDKDYMMPYSDVFEDYHGFLTKVGLSVDRDKDVKMSTYKTLAVAGVNMSVKRKAIEGYSPLAFTLRGTYNESLIALNGIKKGLHSVVFQGAKVTHKDRESLSRTKDKDTANYLALERFVLPYAVDLLGFKIDVELLRRFVEEVDWNVAREGMEIALKGIEGKLKPREVREMLAESKYYKIIQMKKMEQKD